MQIVLTVSKKEFCIAQILLKNLDLVVGMERGYFIGLKLISGIESNLCKGYRSKKVLCHARVLLKRLGVVELEQGYCYWAQAGLWY